MVASATPRAGSTHALSISLRGAERAPLGARRVGEVERRRRVGLQRCGRRRVCARRHLPGRTGGGERAESTEDRAVSCTHTACSLLGLHPPVAAAKMETNREHDYTPAVPKRCPQPSTPLATPRWVGRSGAGRGGVGGVAGLGGDQCTDTGCRQTPVRSAQRTCAGSASAARTCAAVATALRCASSAGSMFCASCTEPRR